MTHRTRSPGPRPLLCLCALALSLPFFPEGAESDEPLPPGVVAEAGGRMLTFDRFCVAAAQQALADVRRPLNGPRSILEQLIEELMVQQECKRLAIVVKADEVKKFMEDWDIRLRRDSNGERNLRKLIQEQPTTEREFVEQVWHVVRKQRIAEHPSYLGKILPKDEHSRLRQIGIVIGQVRTRTDVKYGIWLVDHMEARVRPQKLPAGQVVTVNGVPITMQQFGRALVLRLPGDKVRDYLDKECKTALMNSEGFRISDVDLEGELAHLRRIWPLERELQREEDVKKSRYSRGLLGLVRSRRAGVTEAQVAEEFEKNKDGLYGSHLLVSDVRISFAQRKSLMADAGLRTRRDALKLAQQILRKHSTGVPFEKLVADMNSRRDPTIKARRIHLYKTNRDRLLYSHAARMRDGAVSSPLETLSEVHVIRREGARPARGLDEVRPHVIEVLARRQARKWIEDRITDPKFVRIAWPLPERGDALPK